MLTIILMYLFHFFPPPFSVDIPCTSLGTLYSDLCSKYSPPKFIVEDCYESHAVGGSSKQHDAGYDAFMTGVSFITMVKKLGKQHFTLTVCY